MMGELERIERRQIAIEHQLQKLTQVLEQSLLVQMRIAEQQQQLLDLLEPPTDYPRSTGGTIAVTG